MSEKLPENLENALRIIANQDNTLILEDDIKTLLITGYIRRSLKGSWLISSKGWDYLKIH